MNNENFYRDLPSFNRFLGVCEEKNYHAVPENWDLVITDVVGSTKAIEAGRYQDVNAAGVSSIVVIRNAMKDLDIPYIFGGDGATLLTPSGRRNDLHAALRGLRKACIEAYNLEMRVGVVPMVNLLENGHLVALARYAASKDVCFAMIHGDGVEVAESWVKSSKTRKIFEVEEEGPIFSNFEGFQCRWKPIPSKYGLVASIIVKARATSLKERSDTYKKILTKLQPIVQVTDEGRPIDRSTLKMQPFSSNFPQETSLKALGATQSEKKTVQRKIRKQSLVGRTIFFLGIKSKAIDGKKYKQEIVQNTDFRKFDNVLRMHLDMRRGQLEALKDILQQAEDAGYLYYGIHTASESLITCAVDSFRGSHAHFVDGAAGGYALAAKRIKAMIKAEQASG